MSKCSFEFWKSKISSKYGCGEDAREGGNYCWKHSCVYCKNEGVNFSCVDGVKLVCKGCTNKDFKRLIDNNNELKRLEKEDSKNRNLLLDINKNFLEDAGKVMDELKNGKRNAISRNFGQTVVIPEEAINGFFLKVIDKYNSVLTDEEIKLWKESYQGKKGDLSKIISAEEEILKQLAEERKRKEESDKLLIEQKEKADLIIQEIETELNLSPIINTTELDNKYHNYRSLSLSSLEAIKDELLTIISK